MNRFSTSLLGASLLLLVPLAVTAHESKPQRDYPSHREQRRDREPPRRADRHVHSDQPWEQAHGGGWTHQIGGGGGWFAPWQGDSGHQIQGELLATSPSGHFRFGGEFVSREFKTRVFNVDHVDVDAYQANLVFHGVLNPGHLTPYLGVGIGLHANDFSKKDIERGNPFLDVRDDVGLGYGIFAILGVEFPVGTELSLFAEGRLNLAYQVTGTGRSGSNSYADYYNDRVDNVQSEDMGGGSAVFGARIRF